jgi:hypothetical protein
MSRSGLLQPVHSKQEAEKLLRPLRRRRVSQEVLPPFAVAWLHLKALWASFPSQNSNALIQSRISNASG